jgi:hypothetical protein
MINPYLSKEKHSNITISIKKKKRQNFSYENLKDSKSKYKLHLELDDGSLLTLTFNLKKTYIWHLGYCDMETIQASLHCLYLCTLLHLGKKINYFEYDRFYLHLKYKESFVLIQYLKRRTKDRKTKRRKTDLH